MRSFIPQKHINTIQLGIMRNFSLKKTWKQKQKQKQRFCSSVLFTMIFTVHSSSLNRPNNFNCRHDHHHHLQWDPVAAARCRQYLPISHPIHRLAIASRHNHLQHMSRHMYSRRPEVLPRARHLYEVKQRQWWLEWTWHWESITIPFCSTWSSWPWFVTSWSEASITGSGFAASLSATTKKRTNKELVFLDKNF